jgi:hypothetical protein
MSLEDALDDLRAAKRVSGSRASYAKDNPAEYLTVMSYLDGGPRPSGVSGFTSMGQGLIGVEDVRRGVTPQPPSSGLAWPEAALRPGFVTIKVTPGAANVGGSGSPVAGGNDVLLDLQNGTHPNAMLFWGGAGQRIKVVNCGTWDINAPRSSGAYSRGGPRVRSADGIGPEHISFEGLRLRGSGLCDAFVAAPVNANTLVTVNRMRIDYPMADVAEPAEHVDALQIQGRLRRLELGDCTIGMCGVQAGNDRGKGLMLNLAPEAPFQVALRRVNFVAPNLLTGAAIFQDYRDIAITLEDVWVDKQGPNGNTWGTGSGLFYPQNWVSSGQAPNRVASWPLGTGITGVVREGRPPGGDFCPA